MADLSLLPDIVLKTNSQTIKKEFVVCGILNQLHQVSTSALVFPRFLHPMIFRLVFLLSNLNILAIMMPFPIHFISFRILMFRPSGAT